MTVWRNLTLGDLALRGVAEIRTGPFGTQLRASDYTESGVPVLNVRNLGYGKIRPATLERVNDSVQQRLQGHLLAEGDIVFGRKGAVDRHVLISPQQAGWMQGSDCIRLRLAPEAPLCPEFLSNALLTPSHRNWMESQCSHGATMASLNQEILSRIVVSVPPPPVQRAVVTVLDSFDELMEINDRRIELLEDRARSLFREWFVRFRFPSHERARVESSGLGSIPSGWTVRSLVSLAHFVNGYAFKPSDWGIEGPPIIKIKELKQGVTATTPRYVGATLPAKYVVEPGELLFSWSADLGIYLWPGDRGLLNQHLFRVTPGAEMSREYLFHALQGALPDFRARAQGTTMKHIKRSALTEVSVFLPHPELMRRFTDIVAPIHATVLALRQQSTLLSITRDLLLPRLVTGRLDISDIDVGDLLPEADAA